MKTVDEMTAAELAEWVNGTYRALNDRFVRDVQETPVEQLGRDFGVGFGLAERLQNALGKQDHRA